MRTARLPYWPPRGQQVSHSMWIGGFHCAQASRHASEGIHPAFENGISGPQKGLMSSKNFNFFFDVYMQNVFPIFHICRFILLTSFKLTLRLVSRCLRRLKWTSERRYIKHLASGSCETGAKRVHFPLTLTRWNHAAPEDKRLKSASL